jgi:phospholipase B1
VPTSVDRLRPSDIKIVAAMGDSLTAGNGAGGDKLSEVLLEYRGLSFSIGGDPDIGSLSTLPNILKQFGTQVLGASRQIAPAWLKKLSAFNVAEPGSTSKDLLAQAEELVTRLKSTLTSEDFHNNWKLITVFIGANDVCNSCEDPANYGPEAWTSNIYRSLRYLADNVPRAFVNLVNVLNVNRLLELDDPFCQAMHKIECPCLLDETDGSEWSRALVKDYQDLTHTLVDSGELERDSFTVVVQPFFENFEIPTVYNATTGTMQKDVSYLAADCFHMSGKAHVVAAKALWENMISPIGEKESFTRVGDYKDSLACPDEACPFLRTAANSISCAQDDDSDVDNDASTNDQEETVESAESSTDPIVPLDTELYRSIFLLAPDPSALESTRSSGNPAVGLVAVAVVASMAVIAAAAIAVFYARKRSPPVESANGVRQFVPPSYGIHDAPSMQMLYDINDWQARDQSTAMGSQNTAKAMWNKFTSIFSRNGAEKLPLLVHNESYQPL